MRPIPELLDEIDKNRLDCSPRVKEWIGDELAELRGEVLRFQRDHAYQRYIRRYIANEYDPGENDGRPRCDCGNDCPILEGRLPAMVQGADDPGRAQEDWAVRHPGTPYALLKADDSYREDLASLYNDIHSVLAVSRRDELPRSERDPDSDGDGEADVDADPEGVTA